MILSLIPLVVFIIVSIHIVIVIIIIITIITVIIYSPSPSPSLSLAPTTPSASPLRCFSEDGERRRFIYYHFEPLH